MKKRLIALVALSLLALIVVNARAAVPTAELKVQGNIQVPSCTITPPDDGVYDLGKLSPSLIAANTTTALPEMTKTWTVACDSQTYLSVTAVDNRVVTASQASPANQMYFGLGNINGTGKIGYYMASIRNGIVDGVASSVYYAQAGSTTLTASATPPTGYYFNDNIRYGWSGTNATPIAGRVFTADIRIYPVLASAASMNGPVTDGSKIDGSMTLNFAYAI